MLDVGRLRLDSKNMQNARRGSLGRDLGGQNVTGIFAADLIDVSASLDNTVYGGGPANEVITGPGVNKVRLNSSSTLDPATTAAAQQFVIGTLNPTFSRYLLNLTDGNDQQATGLFIERI